MKTKFDRKANQINYLNKSFDQLKNTLFEYAKAYFPDTYKDFNDGSVGTMFIEQAAYVADVMSYYTDTRLQESILNFSDERKNIINHAISRGYKIKSTTPSQTTLEVFMLIPSVTNVDGTISPDYRYAQTILEGMSATTTDSISFITTSPVDFTVNTSDDPLEISVYQRSEAGVPQNYLLRKTVHAISGEIKTQQFTINEATPFYRITLSETNVVEIQNIVDSDNNKWYEVEYLAQDLISISYDNNLKNNQFSVSNRSEIPQILKLYRTSNRFVTNVTEDGKTYIEFGTGNDDLEDEEIVPNINTVGRGLPFKSETGISYDPSNFMKTKGFGRAPSNTVLTVTYLTGGGIESNVTSNSIINVGQIEFESDINELDFDEQTITRDVRNSIRVNNTEPATGGSGQETDEQIKLNAISNIAAQNRAVTSNDYIIRAYSMPKKFGSISKACIQRNSDENGSVNLYILSYDSNKNLTKSNSTLINNLKTYLSQYRMLTDSVNILDGYIINIGIDFKIFVKKGYSKKEVLLNCVNEVKRFVNIDNMEFTSTLNINKLNLNISNIEGVESVAEIKIKNLTASDGNYSENAYDIENSISNNILYPSLDPSIFEVKFPSKDIRGSSL